MNPKIQTIKELCQEIYDKRPREKKYDAHISDIHLKDNIYLHICNISDWKKVYSMTLQIYEQVSSNKFEMIIAVSINKTLNWIIQENIDLQELQLKLEEKLLILL
ncbi:MAG: hypothetical protein H8D97_01435 [Proteobacteria bacterium]|nr:hypothetical protein [Pseudomonadota bacterium]